MSEAFGFYTPAALESPAGCTAADLESLRAGIASVSPASLFHHVTRIPARFPHARDLPENDFARWVGDALQLPEVSERLAFVGSTPTGTLEELREALLGVLDRVGARDRKRESSDGASFHFIEARTVLVPLELEALEPGDVLIVWPHLDLGSAFYHLVEAPVFGQQDHALLPWLHARGAHSLAETAEALVSAGRSLERLHRDIGTRWRRSMIGRRLVERFQAPEAERRRDAHAAIAHLAGRLKRKTSETEPG